LGNDYVGGLIGGLHYGLDNCFSNGDVNGSNYVGCLAGIFYEGMDDIGLDDSTGTGNVTCQGSYHGCPIGYIFEPV